ncbi:uncharacterized protein LOC131240680 [Magnolia sinica]|uniref:uncharacterized protein LOC131240680 n=1 Tax=Magnolia sinica TaxID=86752 RepID=UPI0026582A97|nr:uncharacterized protein LOC131240680 [Magnolia sinica]
MSSSSEKPIENQTLEAAAAASNSPPLGKTLEKGGDLEAGVEQKDRENDGKTVENGGEGEKTLGKEADIKGREGEEKDSEKTLEKEGDDGENSLEIGGVVGEDHEEEEEGECGFCLFMKGGGCKEEFIAWEKCVEEADKNQEDVVEKCFEVTALLKKCMDAHADYYEPVLRAEKAMEEEVARELERDGADHNVGQGS